METFHCGDSISFHAHAAANYVYVYLILLLAKTSTYFFSIHLYISPFQGNLMYCISLLLLCLVSFYPLVSSRFLSPTRVSHLCPGIRFRVNALLNTKNSRTDMQCSELINTVSQCLAPARGGRRALARSTDASTSWSRR